jgi:DNA-binding LytR/AlgR family response regulator
MKATALIAEDEPLLAQALQAELAVLWPELEVVGIAPNGVAAQRDLLALTPDVAFLDVRMPGASGIEVAQAIAEDWPESSLPPLLVFVTAYEQFAIDAFSQAAVDYVLKPVQTPRLAQTVQRLRQRLTERLAERASGRGRNAGRDDDAASVETASRLEGGANGALEELAAQLQRLLADPPHDDGKAYPPDAPYGGQPPPYEPLRILRAGVGDTVRMIRIEEVIYLQATDKYVSVVTADGESLIREPLRDLVPRLDPSRFTQVHRSTVVNLDFVQSAVCDEAGRLALTLRGRKERLGVSRIYAQMFKAM